MNIRKDIENILCECDQDHYLPDDNMDRMIDRLEQYIICTTNKKTTTADKYLDEIAKNLWFLVHGNCESYAETESNRSVGIEKTMVYLAETIIDKSGDISDRLDNIYNALADLKEGKNG